MFVESPKGRGIYLLCLPKGEGYACCVSQRERDMFVLLLCATDYLPDEGSQGTAHKRADDEDPEVGEGRTTLIKAIWIITSERPIAKPAKLPAPFFSSVVPRTTSTKIQVNMISAISPAEASPSPTLLAPVCVLVTSTPEARMA